MDETGQFWASFIEAYGRLSRSSELMEHVVYPAITEALSTDGPILDFGGGAGELLAHVPSCREVWLFDPNQVAVRLAESRYPDSAHRFTHDRGELPTQYFPSVVLCFVLMSVKNQHAQDELLSQVRQYISAEGVLVVLITHPCFRAHRFSCFETEFTRGRKFRYRTEDQPFTVFFFNQDQTEMLAIPNFHRTLSSTIQSIVSAGFSIEATQELSDFSSNGYYNKRVSPYLKIVARPR